jgi:hypothetical protein
MCKAQTLTVNPQSPMQVSQSRQVATIAGQQTPTAAVNSGQQQSIALPIIPHRAWCTTNRSLCPTTAWQSPLLAKNSSCTAVQCNDSDMRCTAS